MNKIELPIVPAGIEPAWPGQFEVFSWLNFAVNIPTPVYMITTLKPNGLSNVQLSCWGMFAGSGDEPKFVLMVHNYTDTYGLIKANGEFVVNLASIALKDQLTRTISKYDADTDEVLASGLTPEPAVAVKAPRVKEAFAHFECRVDWLRDIEEREKRTTLVMASIVAVAMDQDCMRGAPRDALTRQSLPFHIGEFYDHDRRRTTTDGWLTTLDLTPVGDPPERAK